MRRFAFGREVPSLRGDRGKSAYIGQNHFTCLLTLALSDGSAATLAKAKRLTHFYSVAPLLEKWFACFPTSGDGFQFVFFLLCTHLTVNIFMKNYEFFFP